MRCDHRDPVSVTEATATLDARSIVAALVVLSSWLSPSVLTAQLPECAGNDPAGARAELAAGTALLQEAIEDARRRGHRARSLAEDALARFDRQCELGDPSALAERGAALMLMGEPLRSAQSYDAFLRTQPVGALSARRRRRIEANLQSGEAIVEIDFGMASLFVDGLEFGPLPRSTAVRLPPGPHRFEARAEDGAVIAESSATLAIGAGPVIVRLLRPPTRDASTAGPSRGAAPGVDYSAWYVATATVAAASLAAGIGFFFAVDERQGAYDEICTLGLPAVGCEAVLAERDAALGVSVAAFVLAGASAIALVTVVVMDVSEPEVALELGVRPQVGGASAALAGSF